MKVCARRLWNDAGLELAAGDRFRVVVAPGTWVDASEPPCGPEGYEKPSLDWARPFRRVPSAPWFALCGSIGRTPFDGFQLIPGQWTQARGSGRLQLWANDAWLFYGNNSGALDVTAEVAPRP